MADDTSTVLTVIGEALIDLVPNGGPDAYQARPGGSPFNVAVGLARLGNRTQLMARLSDNAFSRVLRDRAGAEGIDLTLAADAVEPTTLAVVSLDAEGKASYDFYVNGTADWQWSAAEVARLGTATSILHFGSIASWTAPGRDHIHAAVTAARAGEDMLISYDPNVRPLLMGDRAQAREMVEASVGRAHIAKASRDDLDWLYPDTGIEHVATRWHDLGAVSVIVTDGPHGAYAYRPGRTPIHRPGRRVEVVDTVGAGDAFTAGLLSYFAHRDLVAPGSVRDAWPGAFIEAMDEAILVSSIACQRVGADPPTALHRSAARSRDPLVEADLRPVTG